MRCRSLRRCWSRRRGLPVFVDARGRGVRISIDDFGAGYSSLADRQCLPAQTLKIDRSLIRGLPADNDDAAMTKAVVAMAHGLGLQVGRECGPAREARFQWPSTAAIATAVRSTLPVLRPATQMRPERTR